MEKYTPGGVEGEGLKLDELIFGEGEPGFENHSRDYLCPTRDCNINSQLSDIFGVLNTVVGVKLAPFPSTGFIQDPLRIFAIICECEKCFEYYWFHGDEKFAKMIRSFVDRKSEIRNSLLGFRQV
jgi:hypothetical protein